MPSVADLLGAYLAPPVCVCGQIIPDTVVYYGIELGDDADQPIAWINEWHEHCLGEWGFMRDGSEMGIAHAHYDRSDIQPYSA